MGQVHDLDKNPILDIDFPTGKCVCPPLYFSSYERVYTVFFV